MLPVSGCRKKFEDMEINLEEAEIGSVKKEEEEETRGRSLSTRKKIYRHKKTNSEVESLVQKREEQS